MIDFWVWGMILLAVLLITLKDFIIQKEKEFIKRCRVFSQHLFKSFARNSR